MAEQLTLQKLFDTAAQSAAQLFSETGEVLPMMHAVRKDGAHILIPLMWESQKEKQDSLRQLKMALPAFGVQQYVIVAEAWMVDVMQTDAPIGHFKTLKDHPDRRECLTISAADNKGNHRAGLYYILRPEQGPPKLSPLRLFDEADGEFHTLLEA
jgi:hypothetical protein